jgi:magnesium chelatase subunit I
LNPAGREEMPKNLIAKLRNGGHLQDLQFKDGFPHIVNAILAGQDIIFLGERGQAKSRIIRSLVSLLDENTARALRIPRIRSTR